MEKVLVTGSSGFIGMHLCQNLLNDGYFVEGIDDMNDYYDISGFVKVHKKEYLP